MRIAINTLIDDPYKPTGTTVFLRNIVSEFVRLRPSNEYFLFISPANESLYPVGPTLKHLNCHVSNERRTLRILLSQVFIPWYIKRYGIQLYFSPQTLSPPFVPVSCRVVTYLYGTHHWRDDAELSLVKSLYRRTLSNLAGRRSDVIVANSLACRQDIAANLGERGENRLRVVGEGYDSTVFHPGEFGPEETGALQARGVRPRRYVLFVSMIYPYKNLERLIAAFGRAITTFNLDYDLVVVGRIHVARPSEYRQSLRDRAASAGVADRVKLIGEVSQPELAALYRGAALYVQPSLYETFGKTTLEAMGCGTAAVGSRTGGTKELLDGISPMFDPTSEAEMTDAIVRMLTDDNLRAASARKGLERAKTFTFDRQARGLLEAFDAAGGPR